jgi:hypothetical protein
MRAIASPISRMSTLIGMAGGSLADLLTHGSSGSQRAAPSRLSGIMGGTVVAASPNQDEGRLRGVRAGR